MIFILLPYFMIAVFTAALLGEEHYFKSVLGATLGGLFWPAIFAWWLFLILTDLGS